MIVTQKVNKMVINVGARCIMPLQHNYSQSYLQLDTRYYIVAYILMRNVFNST